MKVLHAIPSFFPVVGGAEINTHYITRELPQHGVEPTILTYHMEERWKPFLKSDVGYEGQIPVIRCAGLRPYPNVKYIRAILPELLGVHVIPLSNVRKYFRSADLIHFHDEIDLSLPLAARGIQVPKIYHIRTLEARLASFRRVALRRRILDNSADFFICNSTATADELMSLGIGAERVRVIPNGVDTEIFFPRVEEQKEARRLLFVGRMQRSKGLHILLDAIGQLEEPVELAILVSWRADRVYYEEMKDLASDLERRSGHTIRWRFRLTHEELAEEYRKATLFICPSTGEAFGNVNIEAMACGTPVVASRVGGILDIIDDGVDGRFFTPGDAAELARVLTELLDAPGAREEMAEKGVAKVARKFAWPVVVSQIVDIYRAVVS